MESGSAVDAAGQVKDAVSMPETERRRQAHQKCEPSVVGTAMWERLG